jgi:acetyl esterase/lipase
MLRSRRLAPVPVAALAVAAALTGFAPGARGDTVVLKNGIAYRGVVDRDKPLLWVYDGLKRVVLRDSKVARIDSDASFRNLEVFRLEQPLVVHAGSMPKEVVSVSAQPWNDRGRRTFTYEGSRLGKFIRMEQAIIEMGPHLVKIRGVDGFWQGQLATSQVPREVILAILAKVEQKDKNERIRVARFLIQAEWYAEARAEFERLVKDFPDDADLRDRIAAARASVVQLEAVQTKATIDRCRQAQQPRAASALLKTFPSKEIAADLFSQVGELQRNDEAQAAADKDLAEELRTLADRLSKSTQTDWKKPMLEALEALKDAPDAVRDRFVAWQKAKAEGGKSDDALFALAMSGYVVGADAAVDDLKTATTLWAMRDRAHEYLSSSDGATRANLLEQLEAASLPGDPAQVALKRLDTVTRLAVRMPPPLQDKKVGPATKGPTIHRVRDDQNDQPTEYAVSLPPEYHPLRTYPTVVALHDGSGTPAAIAWWSAEAAKRGYIVVAPEYKLPGQGNEYLYSTSEHAAVELALRDAKRRYAIDSDRVFVGGQLVGANMAWDFGLAHPDLFAGVVVISGLPFKFVNRYLPHTERLPLYVALGDLAPAANEVVFAGILKPLIAKAYDVTYLEYHGRGLEDLPEEAPAVFDWMDRRRRDPYPKAFDVVTARPSDNRFFGVVIHEFQPGRTTAPAAVEPFGKNLNPASLKVTTSSSSNLLRLQTSGLKSFDVWVSPKVLDFSKKLEIRVNGTSRKGQAKPELDSLLEDLRLRGDRQQIYWMKTTFTLR